MLGSPRALAWLPSRPRALSISSRPNDSESPVAVAPVFKSNHEAIMSRLHPRCWGIGATALLALFLAPSIASATEVAVPRLVGNGVGDKQLMAWTSSISSELDFMSAFTGATETDGSGFNASCLSSGACLAKVARAAGCDATVAGAVSEKKGQLDFYLVYADGSTILRTKEFSVANSPSGVADKLSLKLRELITGESSDSGAVAAAGTVDAGAFDDGFDDDDDASFVAPVTTSRRIPTQSSGAGSDELDDFSLDEEEDDRRAGVVAAPVPTRQPPPPPPPPPAPTRTPPPPPPAPAPAEEEFSFALGGGVVSVDEAEDDDQASGRAVAAASYDRTPPPRKEPAAPRRDTSSSRDYSDLDGNTSRDRRDVAGSDKVRVEREPRQSSQGDAPTATFTARLGYSRFQAFNFITYGAEVAFHPIDNLAVLGGIEAYSVRREVPQELQDRGAPPVVWNSIMPLNIGAAYKFFNDPARPYVGGDMLIIPGYVQDASGAAIGLRIRGGVDIMVSDVFGFNVNGAMGIWSGKEFDQLDEEFSSSAMVPQFSAGTVVAF